MRHDQLVILLHSSKTMRSSESSAGLRQPAFTKEAGQLNQLLKSLSNEQIEKAMHISGALAAKTKDTIGAWSMDGKTLAIDSFIGDIYSGLRAQELSTADRDYADSVLWILSGLYGCLRPYDGVSPYRLEMGYKLPGTPFKNLYGFWGEKLAQQLPEQGMIVNVSSVEYTKAVLPFVDASRVITPNFLTINPKTGEPGFTAVHAKIARGAFARWLITTRITDPKRFREFNDLGYRFDEARSTDGAPVFTCKQFEGLGLSIRLQ
jgi:hypothetical protein